MSIKNTDYFDAKVTQRENTGNFSQTFVSQTSSNEFLIREAYERIGIVSDLLTVRQIDGALNSMNLILQSWINRGIRQFMLKTMLLGLIPGVSSYILSDSEGRNLVRDINNMKISTVKNTVFKDSGGYNGLPVASSGVAANAFDGDSGTTCTQTAADGWIGFQYRTRNIPVVYVGVTSKTTKQYSLEIIASNSDILPSDGNFVASRSNRLPKQTFTAGEVKWLEVPSYSVGKSLYVREYGGETLDITELSFSSVISDRLCAAISRSDYFACTSRNNSFGGVPYCYFFEKNIQPYLHLYPLFSQADNSNYVLKIQYKAALMDVGGLMNLPEIPALFYGAMIAELAARLALKEGKLDLLQLLKADAMQEFEEARIQDTEDTAVSFSPDPYSIS